MAKRDKLYTVNKWNKPFFEEERRKRLYGFGDALYRVIPGMNESQGAKRVGLGYTWDASDTPRIQPLAQ
jgi:hypothetical protein